MALFSRHAWTFRERNRKPMNGRVRNAAPGKFAQLKHGQTHYELDDENSGPLLICTHGWSTASYVWEPLKRHFRAKGYRVLSYDLYGRGYSDRPDGVAHTAAFFSEQLAELLEYLQLGRTRLNIVGYSMGGAIAARFISERLEDVDRFLLIAPAGMEVRAPGFRAFARDNPKVFDAHILALLPLVLRRQFRKAASGHHGNADVVRVAQQQEKELTYQGYVEALLSSVKGVLAFPMAKEHKRIANHGTPVRAIFAESDTTIPIKLAMPLFDQWHSEEKRRVIPAAGHAVTYTHPNEIMREIDGFL